MSRYLVTYDRDGDEPTPVFDVLVAERRAMRDLERRAARSVTTSVVDEWKRAPLTTGEVRAFQAALRPSLRAMLKASLGR